MAGIPKAKSTKSKRIEPTNIGENNKPNTVLFSFEAIERNEYFNLDGTCQNWAADLIETMQKVSGLTMSEIYAGKYSGKTSPFRIHQHEKANAPCKVPPTVSLENMWQIRISKSKGGIHGIFADNVFYVIWFDPHHNLYPDENHGGLKKIIPPSTCCKDRDEQLTQLSKELDQAKADAEFWEKEAMAREAKGMTGE